MELLYSDDRIAVCIKPAGVVATDEPGGMPELLRDALGCESVRSVHRLDRVVGGVMVYALTRRAASDLGSQMQNGGFRKEYLAVVHGCPREPQGTMRDHLLRDTAKRKSFLASEDTPGAQEANLDYRFQGTSGGLSLLSIRLYTGRTHQIRCQLSGRGMPIVGDRKYGWPEDDCAIALWSCGLSFLHPRTGERLSFARMPEQTYPWMIFREKFPGATYL